MLVEIDIAQQILEGGVIAIAIVALSIILLTLTIVHLLTLRRATQCPEELLEAVEQQVRSRKLDAALKTTGLDPSALAVVLEGILRRHDSSPDRLREVLSEGTAEQSLRLTQRISWIGLVAAVAPMMGLLGTVSGMIRAFATMSASAGSPDPADLAGAISEALITTYLGLTVAIPALVIYAIFKHRVLGLVLRIGEMGEHLLEAMSASPAAGSFARRRSTTPTR